MDDIYFSDKPNQNKRKPKSNIDESFESAKDTFSGDPMPEKTRKKLDEAC